MDRDALVIGAGVIGLTSALRLAEEGWRVRIRAAEPPERTTSAVAAAIWYPYRVGPAERVPAWGERSFHAFVRLAADPETGVRMTPGVELLRAGSDPARPAWAAPVPDFQVVPMPGDRLGWAMTLPVVSTGVYLRWLRSRLERLGVPLEIRRLGSLAEAAAEAALVVHCAGLGARELAPDDQVPSEADPAERVHAVEPIRGQVVRVKNPGITRFWIDDDDAGELTYIIPRGDDCVLGGTDQVGQWDVTPDEAIADAIIRRCVAVEPALADAPVLDEPPPRVGLRPWRRDVRLEVEPLPGGQRVIHNYGHGGAGVTLSWGCADRVVELANGRE